MELGESWIWITNPQLDHDAFQFFSLTRSPGAYISILLAVVLNPPQPGPEPDLLCYLFLSQENVRKKKIGLPRIPLPLSPPLSLSQFVAIPCNRTLKGEGWVSLSLCLSQFVAIPSNRILKREGRVESRNSFSLSLSDLKPPTLQSTLLLVDLPPCSLSVCSVSMVLSLNPLLLTMLADDSFAVLCCAVLWWMISLCICSQAFPFHSLIT